MEHVTDQFFALLALGRFQRAQRCEIETKIWDTWDTWDRKGEAGKEYLVSHDQIQENSGSILAHTEWKSNWDARVSIEALFLIGAAVVQWPRSISRRFPSRSVGQNRNESAFHSAFTSFFCFHFPKKNNIGCIIRRTRWWPRIWFWFRIQPNFPS